MNRKFLAVIDDQLCINYECPIYATNPSEMMKEAKFILFIIIINKKIKWNQIRLHLIFQEEDIELCDTESKEFSITFNCQLP